jgi:hypothetical protein
MIRFVSLRARVVPVMVTVALAAGIGACETKADVARGPYVRQNLATLKSIPAFPRARLVRVGHVPWRSSERDDAPVEGYATTKIYNLPRGVRPEAAIRFYRRALASQWTQVAGSHEYTSLRNNDAYLHVLAGRGRVYLEMDHDCYKGDESPHCFGP